MFLQHQLAKLYREVIPALETPAATLAPRQKIRIGVISRFFYSHAITFCFGELLHRLSLESGFELYLFAVGAASTPAAGTWPGARIVFLDEMRPLLETAESIRQSACHLLIYLEIGMDRLTYLLAYSRLAPVQVMLAGHPVTSGIPTLYSIVTGKQCFPVTITSRHYQ